jgi:hypothetical protein
MSRLGTKKDVQFVKSVAFPISLKRVDDLKQYLDTKNVHANADIMFEDAKHTKRFTDIPWNILRMVVVIYHHDKGKVSSQEILDAIKTYRLSVPLNKNGANIKSAKYYLGEEVTVDGKKAIINTLFDGAYRGEGDRVELLFANGTKAIYPTSSKKIKKSKNKDIGMSHDEFVAWSKPLVTVQDVGVTYNGDYYYDLQSLSKAMGYKFNGDRYVKIAKNGANIKTNNIKKKLNTIQAERLWEKYIRESEKYIEKNGDDEGMVEKFQTLAENTVQNYVGAKIDSNVADHIIERLGLICGGSEGSAYAQGNFDKAIVEIKTYLKKIKPKQAKNGANIGSNDENPEMVLKNKHLDRYPIGKMTTVFVDGEVKEAIVKKFDGYNLSVKLWNIGDNYGQPTGKNFTTTIKEQETILINPDGWSADWNKYADGGGIEREFVLNNSGNFFAKINNKNYEIIYRDDRTQMYDLFENNKKIKSSKSVRALMQFPKKYAKGGYVFKGDKYEYTPLKFTYTIGGL